MVASKLGEVCWDDQSTGGGTMKGMKTMGVCVVAAFAIGGTAAVSASAALPEFYECHKGAKGSGEFSDKKCSMNVGSGKGAYTLQPGIGKGKAFKGKGGAAKLETVGGAAISCTSSSDSGNLASPTTETNVLISFKKCSLLGKSCSTGTKKGEITSSPLEGTLGYVNKAAGKDGPVYVPSNESEPWSKGTITCTGGSETIKVETTGGVIGVVTGNVNTFNKLSTLDFTENEGKQQFSNFEGGPLEVLESTVVGVGKFETGLQATFINKGEELEIRA